MILSSLRTISVNLFNLETQEIAHSSYEPKTDLY